MSGVRVLMTFKMSICSAQDDVTNVRREKAASIDQQKSNLQ